MKILQDLVRGCNKVIGKALVLDEIINYVQSLQRQVEVTRMGSGAIAISLPFSWILCVLASMTSTTMENQALRFSLHSSKVHKVSMTKQESAVLLLESLLLGSLLWLLGIVCHLILPGKVVQPVIMVKEKLPSLEDTGFEFRFWIYACRDDMWLFLNFVYVNTSE